MSLCINQYARHHFSYDGCVFLIQLCHAVITGHI